MGLASLVNSRSSSAVYLAILGSRTAQDGLINRFNLRKEYHCRYYVTARKVLARRTTISVNKQTGVVTISVIDGNPSRARALVSAYVDELNKLVVVMDTSSAHRERVFLEGRLKSVKRNLAAASQQLSQFSSRHATLDVQYQASATLQATARLQGQLIAAQSELRSLQAIYSPENVRIRAAQARVNTLQAELQKMSGADQAGNTALNANQPYPSLRQLPLLGATYVDLYRRFSIQETLYETLTKEYELAKVQEAKETPTVTVLDPPNLPERKSFPPRILIIVIGVFLALFGIIAWVILNQITRVTPEAYPTTTALLAALATIRSRKERVKAGV
jgi:capsule polysaccharide export protein KpsE/RkpR